LPKNSDCQDGRNKESERQRNRWTDEVYDDLRRVGIRNSHSAARNLKEWKRIVLETKILSRL
jgi:hypothetical protein